MSKIEEKNNRELKFEPMGGALSWRDIVRNFVLDKYGLTGKRLADSLIGASEEDMALNYLQRTYGSELPEGVNVNRPISDMLEYGVSDFGLLDLGLLGMSGGASALPKGVGTTAAALETGALVGDAVGEYEKGNTLAASIMGGLAATPAVLRYGFGTRNTPTEIEFDPSRRKFMKDAGVLTGGIAALSVLPPAFRGAGEITAKLLSPKQQAFNFTINALGDGVGEVNLSKNVLENMSKVFGGRTQMDRLINDYSMTPRAAKKMLTPRQIEGYPRETFEDKLEQDYLYNLFYLFDDASRTSDLNFSKFNKLMDKNLIEHEAFIPTSSGKRRKAWLDVWNSPEFRKSAYNEFGKLKAIAESDVADEINKISKERVKIMPRGHFYTAPDGEVYNYRELYPDLPESEVNRYFELSGKQSDLAMRIIESDKYEGFFIDNYE